MVIRLAWMVLCSIVVIGHHALLALIVGMLLGLWIAAHDG